jgi:hypothetical protein
MQYLNSDIMKDLLLTFFFLFFLFFFVGDSTFFNQGRTGEFRPEVILSLEILTNLSAFILVTCSAHSLLHPLFAPIH